MGELLDVRLACCILHRKRLISGLKQLSPGEKLEFIAENTESVKKQIQEILKTENCRIIDEIDENGTVRIIVQRS